MSKNAQPDPLSDLGVRLSPGDRAILSVLLSASDVENTLTVGEIAERAASEYGLNVGQNWVYKCIEELAEAGFVVVDKLRRPATCFATHEMLARGLQRLIDLRIAELLRRRRVLEEEAALLNSVTGDAMAEFLISELAASSADARNALVLGRASVLSTILDMISKASERGATIRFMQNADAVPEGSGVVSTFERGVFEAIERGVRIRALITAASEHSRNRTALLDFVDGLRGPVLSPLRSGKLQIRFHTKAIRSYRMMAVDRSSMLLFMSESYMPEAVRILRSPQDDTMIGDAIETFEQRWAESIDMAPVILDGASTGLVSKP